jgi:hypothetical protein
MDVVYGETAITIPPDVQQTEITTYLWPRFLGEFDHSTSEFIAWELAEPSRWILRPDIVAPPYSCIGVDTSQGWRWTSSEERWLALGPSLWRRIGYKSALPET